MEEFYIHKRPKQYAKCYITNCKSHLMVDKESLSFFLFPKDPVRSAMWIKNSKCDELKSISNLGSNQKYRLCSLHFESKMFSNFQRNQLYKDAIPTLFDVDSKQCVNEPVTNIEVHESHSSCSTPGTSHIIFYYKYTEI